MIQPEKERWSGRVGFVLATIGSAIGLGSIWKFPYEVGENGGAGFVLFYVVGLSLVVVPLLLAEFLIGRRGRGDAAMSLGRLARESGASGRWAWVGWLGIATGFIVLTYYSVVAGTEFAGILHWVHSPWPRKVFPALELVAEVPFERGSGPDRKDAVQWSVLPQARIGLNKRGNIALNAGLELPLNDRDRFDWRVYVYFIWDFADGGLLEGW